MAQADASKSQLPEAYRQFDRDLRIVRSKAGYALALILMPAGITLDHFVYPELLGIILKARLLCDLALLVFFALCFSKWRHKIAWILDKPCVLLPTISISWMIYASEGAMSPYYAGLNLMVIGGCLLIPYTAKEAALMCALILIFYATACLIFKHHPPSTAMSHVGGISTKQSLYNNIYFIALTSIICVTCCHYFSGRRFEDFRLRHELDVNNRELGLTLTRLKATEVQLVQSEKMNALGKLSAGLLHEVNNPLNFTFMALEAAQADAADETMKDTLNDIHQGMSRIRSVIADLRGFAYPTQLSGAESFSLDDVMATAQRLTAHELNDVTVNKDGIKGFVARGSKDQIVHVLMNLLVNSAQATKSKATGRPAKIDVTCEVKGKLLAVTVRDNGVGVKPEHLAKLCEPFFTTKAKGQGTGLGLSICQTIIENHGGKISVASEEGQWTAVTFELPSAESETSSFSGGPEGQAEILATAA